MAKRRRQIKKKIALQQAQQHQEAVVGLDEEEKESAGPVAETVLPVPAEPELDDSMVVSPSPPPVAKPGRKARREEKVPAEKTSETSWLGRNKENLLLGMLVLYVFLLGLGTVGELFELEWILNLPLFR